jgi:hypothetical protein
MPATPHGYETNQKTVADAPTAPKGPAPTVPTVEGGAVIIAAMRSRLPRSG